MTVAYTLAPETFSRQQQSMSSSPAGPPEGGDRAGRMDVMQGSKKSEVMGEASSSWFLSKERQKQENWKIS